MTSEESPNLPSKIHTVILYADDTIILKSTSDPDSLISSLEMELSINKTTVNTKKK